MPAQALKGQEVELRLIVDGKLQDTITEIVDLEVTYQMEIKKRSLLGETSDRRDDVFNGTAGKITLNFADRAVLDLATKLADRARRRTKTFKVNIKAAFNFPDASRAVGIVEDVFFGEIPIGFSSRTDYGTVALSFESANPIRWV